MYIYSIQGVPESRNGCFIVFIGKVISVKILYINYYRECSKQFIVYILLIDD